MPLTIDKIKELNRLIDIFFEKVGRKERLSREILKLMDECVIYLYPKIREWLENTREQIARDIKKKILRKSAELTEIRKKSKSEIIVDYVDWEMIEENGKSIIKPAYLNIMERSGNLSRAQARIEASFDVINPLSIKWADKYSSELVTLVGKETKAGLREIVSHGLDKGKTLQHIARDIEATGIGLNEIQTGSLLKYGDFLDAQGLKGKEYLDKFNKYYDRLQKERCELIARTEANRSVNEGYLDSLEGTEYEEVEISSAFDACDECLDMAGHKYTRDEARGLLPKHPRCRCHWIVVPEKRKKPKEPEAEIPEVKLPGWEPAKTTPEAYAFAHRELVKEYGLVDYGRIDMEGINTINEELFRLVKKYNIKVDNLGSAQGLTKRVEYLFRHKTPFSTYAITFYNKAKNQISLGFNEFWWSTSIDRKVLKKSMQKCIETGFHKLATFEGVVSHEYGHVLDITKKVSSQLEVYNYWHDTDKIIIKNTFGDYANQEPAEFFAEAFCNYEAKNLPKKEMGFIANIIKKYILK